MEVLRRMRSSDPGVPVLFLTARDSVEDRVAGLTAGGDDYVTKPFSLEEVVARLRALMRRTGAHQASESRCWSSATCDGRGQPRGQPRRRGHLPDGDRVRAAAVPDAQPQAGAVEGADPRPGLELRLRRPGQRRRALHLLPAQEDRRRPRADDPHHARGRVRPEARLDADRGPVPLADLAAGADGRRAGGRGLACWSATATTLAHARPAARPARRQGGSVDRLDAADDPAPGGRRRRPGSGASATRRRARHRLRSTPTPDGYVLGRPDPATRRALRADSSTPSPTSPPTATVHDVSTSTDLGDYRVTPSTLRRRHPGVVVTGLPTDDVDDTVAVADLDRGRCWRCWRSWPRRASAPSSYAASCGPCARSPPPPTRCPSCRWPPARSRWRSGCPSTSPTSAPRSARSARR